MGVANILAKLGKLGKLMKLTQFLKLVIFLKLNENQIKFSTFEILKKKIMIEIGKIIETKRIY